MGERTNTTPGAGRTGPAESRGTGIGLQFGNPLLSLGICLFLLGGAPAVAARAQRLRDGGTSNPPAATSPLPTPSVDAGNKPVDASIKPDAASIKPDAAALPVAATSPSASLSAPPAVPPPPMPQFKEESLQPAGTAQGPSPGKGKRGKAARSKATKAVLTDLILESQNHSQAIARRYAQLLAGGRYDEARLMHEEEGGRHPDWPNLRAAAQAHNELHGAPKDVEQHLTTWTGAELLTFFFTARYKDGSELPIRVAVDHNGHVAGAGVGGEIVAALKKRYDRYDHYRPKSALALPFYGTWTVSNASPGSGNGHYLNANQRFAIDFFITEDVDGKRKSHRDRGRQNLDYFAFAKDVLAPADGTVIMVVDGVPDNPPGQVDIYYRLGNSIVISLGNSEYAHLCHLQNGSMQVRVGDKVNRGQVVAKCGNSGNSTAPHLHFQLTDGPLVSHAASLPAYFTLVQKDGGRSDVLPASGDRLTQLPPPAAATPPAP